MYQPHQVASIPKENFTMYVYIEKRVAREFYDVKPSRKAESLRNDFDDVKT